MGGRKSDALTSLSQWGRRESLGVTSCADRGLGLGVLTFIVIFYVIYTLNASVWWFASNIILLFVLSRVLAGLLGGVVGDEVGFRYARRKLVEEWREYEAARNQQPPTS